MNIKPALCVVVSGLNVFGNKPTCHHFYVVRQ